MKIGSKHKKHTALIAILYSVSYIYILKCALHQRILFHTVTTDYISSHYILT